MEKGPIYRLSQDMVDAIIDANYSDLLNRAALSSHHKSCPLVCRSFTARSQANIFRNIKLGTPEESEEGSRERASRIKELREMMQQNPGLSSYIMCIHIIITPDNDWLGNDETFLEVMKALVNGKHAIERVTLEGHYRELVCPSAVLTKFFPVILPYVASLELQSIPDFPLSILASSPKLKILQVSDTDLTLKNLDTFSNHYPPSSRPRLHHLEYYSAVDSIRTLAKSQSPESTMTVELSTLQTLKVHMYNLEDVIVSQDLIEKASGTLRNIFFSSTDNPNYVPFTGHINLCQVRQLHRLVLDFVVGNKTVKEDPLAGVNSILQTIRTLRILDITIHDQLSYGHSPEHFIKADWPALEREIGRISNGNALDVRIDLRYLIPRNVAKANVHATIEDVFTPICLKAQNFPHIRLETGFRIDNFHYS